MTRAEGRATEAAQRPRGPGLVPSSTSRTVEIDPTDSRLRGMKKTVINSARCLRDGLQASGAQFRMAMVTLTYAEVAAWRPNHLSRFFGSVRKYFSRRGLRPRYVFVAELLGRGAVHYHVLFFLPRGLTLPKPDKQGWWPHGSTRIEWAKKAVGYLAKYVSKLVQKECAFPRGLRISGAGGLDADSRNECRWWKLPSYVREMWALRDYPARVAGGGFVSLASGEWIASRYRFLGLRGGKPILIDLWATS